MKHFKSLSELSLLVFVTLLLTSCGSAALEEKLRKVHELVENEHRMLEAEADSLLKQHLNLDSIYVEWADTIAAQGWNALTESHKASMEQIRAMIQRHQELVESHTQLEKEHASGTKDKKTIEEEHARMQKEHEQMKQEHQTIKAELERMKKEHEEFEARNKKTPTP
jgi:hypothetical protein